MRKIITTVLTVATLALPIVDASAATKAAKKKIVVTKRFAGSVASGRPLGQPPGHDRRPKDHHDGQR